MERMAAARIERDVVIVVGIDAVSYVHGQLTQDVEGLPVGGSAWSFLLEPKAEIVALMRVSRLADDTVAMDLPIGLGASIRERMDSFLFRMDVRFSEARWSGFSIRGPGASEAAAEGEIVMRNPWPGCEGTDVLGPSASIPEGLDELGQTELDALRIRLGWPSMDDFDARTTPAMTGIVAHTVSFTKGCYPGQEFVARVHYRDAAPPRRLAQVGFHPVARPSVGDPVLLDGEEVGRLTSVSAHQPLALAMVERRVEVPGDAAIPDAPVCLGLLPASAIEPDKEPPKRTTSPLTLG